MDVYFLGHLGLGDNLYCIGAARYLTIFYDNVYFLCKDKYITNMEMIFQDEPNIRCVPINTNNEEINECRQILSSKYEHNDVLICGMAHKPHYQSKITNIRFLTNKPEDKQYSLECDMITDAHYSFIREMYNDAKMNLTVMFDYWHIPTTSQSRFLYESVKDYNIVFIQSRTSNDKRLNIDKLLHKYLHDEKTILISNDENLYFTEKDNGEIMKRKYELCQPFICNKLCYYLDTLVHSSEIYIIDSCFGGLVIPLYRKKMLKAHIVRIIIRRIADKIEL